MIGILGGMGTQAGLDFCSKLAKLNRGKADQKYPLFVLYNKSNIPDRKQNLKKYNKVLKSLLEGCKLLEKNKCKFIVIPCNTAHYWFDDLQRKINIAIVSFSPQEQVIRTVLNSIFGKQSKKILIKTTNQKYRPDKIFCKINRKKLILKRKVPMILSVCNKIYKKNKKIGRAHV